jgi:hypothetical protein
LRIEQRPLEYLLGHTAFSQAFGSVLVPATSIITMPQGCLAPIPMTARFDSMAQDVRSTLEAEAMAWGTLAKLADWGRHFDTTVGFNVYREYVGIDQARRLVSETNVSPYDVPTETTFVPFNTTEPLIGPSTSMNSILVRATRMGLTILPTP